MFLDALRRQAKAFAAWVRGAEATGATAADAVATLAAAEQAEGEHDSATRHQSDYLDQ
jgi:hypothetical protein